MVVATNPTSPRFKRIWSIAPPRIHSPVLSPLMVVTALPGYNTRDTLALLSPTIVATDITLCYVLSFFLLYGL